MGGGAQQMHIGKFEFTGRRRINILDVAIEQNIHKSLKKWKQLSRRKTSVWLLSDQEYEFLGIWAKHFHQIPDHDFKSAEEKSPGRADFSSVGA